MGFALLWFVETSFFGAVAPYTSKISPSQVKEGVDDESSQCSFGTEHRNGEYDP